MGNTQYLEDNNKFLPAPFRFEKSRYNYKLKGEWEPQSAAMEGKLRKLPAPIGWKLKLFRFGDSRKPARPMLQSFDNLTNVEPITLGGVDFHE
jgi:hypothetical protein